MEWFSNWWSTLPSFERFFWLFAIPATILVLIQLILTFMGLDDMDADGDIDFDGDGDVDFDADGDGGFFDEFPIISIRNIIAFFAMFGWTGAVMTRSGASNGITVIVALLAGFFSMVLMTILFKLLMSLASSGNVSIKGAIGKKGEVYMPIPAEMKDFGKVTVVVAEKQLEYKAVTKGDTLETGAPVKVIDIINNKLLVERL